MCTAVRHIQYRHLVQMYACWFCMISLVLRSNHSYQGPSPKPTLTQGRLTSIVNALHSTPPRSSSPLATAPATAHHHYTSTTTQTTKPRAADGCQLGRLASPIYCSQNNHCQYMCSASPSSQRSCQRLAYYCGLEDAFQQRPRVNWCIPASAASCCYACCSSTCDPTRQYAHAAHISPPTQTGTCAGATWNHHPHLDLHQQQQHIR
jgi:hypothetical protein